MSKVTVGVLVGLVVIGLAGGTWYYIWDNSIGGPDRSDLLKPYLQNMVITKDPPIEIIKQKHVKNAALDAVRKNDKYKTLEIINVKFRHPDALGTIQTNSHHVFLLDGKIIHAEGLFFEDAHKGLTEEQMQKYIEGRVARSTGAGGGPPPGMGGGGGGGPGGGGFGGAGKGGPGGPPKGGPGGAPKGDDKAAPEKEDKAAPPGKDD